VPASGRWRWLLLRYRFFQNLVGDPGRFIPYHQQTIVFKVYLCHKDPHLTNGGRSIPKLIVLSDDLKALSFWGPRPTRLQQLMKQWKDDVLGLKELIPKVHG